MTHSPWLPDAFVSAAEAWPLRAGLVALRDQPVFPPVARWGALLAAAGMPDPGVRFERQAPRPRRRTRVASVGAVASGSALPGYDASIVERGVVPSREGSWHDLLNCLAWHAFPRGKAALHRRQLAAQRAEAAGGARRVHARSPHRDALALLDEGGVLLGRAGVGAGRDAGGGAPARDGVERFALFGHALHEQRLRGPAVVTALLLELELAGPPPEGDAAWLTALDAALAAALADGGALARPAAHPRVAVQLGQGRIERLALPG